MMSESAYQDMLESEEAYRLELEAFEFEFPNWEESTNPERFVSESDYYELPPVFRRYGSDDMGRME